MKQLNTALRICKGGTTVSDAEYYVFGSFSYYQRGMFRRGWKYVWL